MNRLGEIQGRLTDRELLAEKAGPAVAFIVIHDAPWLLERLGKAIDLLDECVEHGLPLGELRNLCDEFVTAVLSPAGWDA